MRVRIAEVPDVPLGSVPTRPGANISSTREDVKHLFIVSSAVILEGCYSTGRCWGTGMPCSGRYGEETGAFSRFPRPDDTEFGNN